MKLVILFYKPAVKPDSEILVDDIHSSIRKYIDNFRKISETLSTVVVNPLLLGTSIMQVPIGKN